MKGNFSAFLVAILTGLSSVKATPYEVCTSPDFPEPADLRVTDCEETPCNFHRGKDVYAEVDFMPPQDMTKLTPWVQATVLGGTVNYTLPEQDGCKTLKEGQECPLKKDEKYTFVLDLPILKAYPKVSLFVQLTLLDGDTQEAVACFKIEGKVK
ncbi:hypothetical protein L9F63_019988 [Diploptera punctata]|uniref:MD-2-related lipid-recognition domain-containing protein n=1 Tax=Diploptera punctata TaxID=6984 RepID=A0AAD7ZTW8_DIPPU|nr:hypothetical protein L9F63_019988 [Diploptera punctata]